jgi:hypothetical protein
MHSSFAERVDCRNEGAATPSDENCQQPDRTAPKHQYVRTCADVVRTECADAAGKRLRKHCAAGVERIRNGNKRPARYDDAIREGARTVHAEQAPTGTKIVLACRTPLTLSAPNQRVDNVPAALESADYLMPENKGRDARAGVPPERMQV